MRFLRPLLILVALLSPAQAQQQTFSNYVNGLPASGTLTGPEFVYILQNGVSKKTTVSALRAAIPVPPTPPPPSFTPAWQDLRMGAGGLTSDIKGYADGTKLVRTDTYGGYLYKATGSCTGWGSAWTAPCWQQLVTATSMPASVVNVDTTLVNVGVIELVACPSNTSVLYMAFGGRLFVSIDQGAHWVRTTASTNQDPNGGPKYAGPFIACDPNNPDIVYFGTDTITVKSINGTAGASGGTSSATFSTIATVGTTGAIPSIIIFDPNSLVVGGVSQHLWIFTYGTGVYETTNGGTTWTLTAGTPTTFTHAIADKFSQLWVVNATSTVKMYLNGTGWTTAGAIGGAKTGYGIAADPNSASKAANKLIITNDDGGLAISVNNGGAFSDSDFPETRSYVATGAQPGWLGTASQAAGGGIYTTSYGITIDASSNVWQSGGISVWTVPNPAVDTALTFSANAVGLEQLVTNQVFAPPGISPVVAVWDRGVYQIKNPDVFPSVQYPNSTSINQIEGAWGIDWAASSVGFLTVAIASNISSDVAPAKSTDGGQTWNAWASNPSGFNYGSLIAASTPTNWLVFSSQDSLGGTLQFTTNGATSWSASTNPGCTGTISNNVNNNRQALAADRVTSGTFYVIDTNGNVCRSTNNGATFALQRAGPMDGSPYRDSMQSVPGQAGHLFFTPGPQPGAMHPSSTSHLWKTTNGGGNFAPIASATLLEPWKIGFGVAQPGGGGYPTLYVMAWLSGVQCICQSVDGGTTWTAINVPTSEKPWALNSLDDLDWISGDMNVFGRVYVGFHGSGAAYIDTADACPWVNFSNVKPTSALTGAAVTLQATASGLPQTTITSVGFYLDGALISGLVTRSGAGTTNSPYVYQQSFNASGATPGAHTLKVQATGNGCVSSGNSFTIPITTS